MHSDSVITIIDNDYDYLNYIKILSEKNDFRVNALDTFTFNNCKFIKLENYCQKIWCVSTCLVSVNIRQHVSFTG